MKIRRNLGLQGALFLLALPAIGFTQVPDLLNSLEAGGRSMGMGGALDPTASDTLSSNYNPASLGFLDQKQFGLTFRNLPGSKTKVGNSRLNPLYSSQGSGGSNALSHIGIALPMKNGTIGLAYTVGGYIDDNAVGPNSGLPDGAILIGNYKLNRQAKSDFYTVSYGRAASNGSSAFGAGLVLVQQHVSYQESGNAVDQANNPVPFSGSNLSSDGNGFGVLIGGQFVPAKTPNASYGISLRTPIELTNNSATKTIYDRIPGRLLGGFSYRRDGLREGEDYLVYGAQLQYFFGGKSSFGFDRTNQTVFGLGAEYNYAMTTARIPLRVGYETVPSGGSGFGRRNAFTYGLGYHPTASDFGVDLNWAAPENGGTDFALSLSYRFK